MTTNRLAGEQVDDRVRAEMLDEALDILTSAWSGRPVRHRGPHFDPTAPFDIAGTCGEFS